MSTELSNNLGGSTKEGIRMTTDVEFYRDSANVLRTPDSLTIDTDIYQDDIVYPYVTSTALTGLTTITIKIRKFNAVDSANNYHLVHWWISTSTYGASATLTQAIGNLALAITAGIQLAGTTLPLNINSTTSGLQTSMTNNNETITFTLTASSGGSGVYSTAYIMTEVQGILYSTSFSYDTSV